MCSANSGTNGSASTSVAPSALSSVCGPGTLVIVRLNSRLLLNIDRDTMIPNSGGPMSVRSAMALPPFPWFPAFIARAWSRTVVSRAMGSASSTGISTNSVVIALPSLPSWSVLRMFTGTCARMPAGGSSSRDSSRSRSPPAQAASISSLTVAS